MWNEDFEQWLNYADFIQITCFLIAFDTEITMGVALPIFR